MKNSRQRRRVLFQSGFFILFILAPVFDLFRLDLNLKHFIFFGLDWTLGLDDFLAGRIGPGQAALNLVLRGFLPIVAVVGTVLWVAWKYGRLYCGWLCPHFSVVETVNRLMRRAIAKHSLWDRKKTPARNPDGTVLPSHPVWWLVTLPVALGLAFTWAVVLLTYLLPPAEIYGNLWHGELTRHQAIFIGVGTTLFFIDFVLARHLFCRYACAVGLFQSLAWMANRKGMVVGFDRLRARDCASCYSACDHVCPMRLHPRSVKRLMFACVQCGQCLDACAQTQAGNPRGPLLHWAIEEAAQWESAFNAHVAAERDRRLAGSCAAVVSKRTCHTCNEA
jgi:polyferredoxin